VAIHSIYEHQKKNPRYSNILRCIGQTIEATGLKALEVKTHGDSFIVQGWNRGTSASMDLEKHYTLEEIQKLEIEGREKRKPTFTTPNLLSVSEVLRLAGNYVDRARGRLLRVSWQDQSDKIQSVTIQYEPFESNRRDHTSESPIATIEELCIHVYKQRKKITAGPDKSAPRPFVNLSKGS
jgi:hypothetical protein